MKINVDAGHGTNTAGKRTPPLPVDIDIDGDGKIDIKKEEQYREHYANVGVASFLKKELKRCGFATMETGFNDENASDDENVSLALRQSAIAKGNCDYSISIHFNSYGDGKSFNTAEGISVYIHNKYAGQSPKLAQIVLNHLAEGTQQKSRGVFKKSFAMCNCNAMDTKAAILCELAFMTNERESTLLMANQSYWKESAKEICKGFCEYTGVKYVKEVDIPEDTITPTSSVTDIKWAQDKLNRVLPIIPGITPLAVDGIYGAKTRIAVLIYWERLGWGKDMIHNGTKIGKSTRAALAAGKEER